MVEALVEDVGTLPKELLAFIERKAERAIEVLREIVMEPEYQNVSMPQGLGNGLVQGLGQFGGLANQLGMQQAAQQWSPSGQALTSAFCGSRGRMRKESRPVIMRCLICNWHLPSLDHDCPCTNPELVA